MDFRSQILDYTTRFEELLTERHGAIGGGLCSKAKSVRSKLPSWMIHRLRFVGKIRNSAVHNYRISEQDQADAIKACKALEGELGLPPIILPLEGKQEPLSTISRSASETKLTPFEIVPPATIVPQNTTPTNHMRSRDVVASLAIVMIVISLIGALLSDGFTTPIEHGFDIPRGIWPFDWTEHAVKSTDVYNLWYYLLWIGGVLFMISRFLN